jgi:hypothetical protein
MREASLFAFPPWSILVNDARVTHPELFKVATPNPVTPAAELKTFPSAFSSPAQPFRYSLG